MNENNLDEQDILKNTDVNVDESTDTDESEDNESLSAQLEKARQDYQNQKIRAEKAEAKLKGNDSTRRIETSKDVLSPFDLIAVTKANLDEEGLSEVMEYAKFKKISISEALKSSAVKAIIAEREENKKVAEATNTGQARRGTSKVSDDVLLENARKGIMPDSDADIKRLLSLRRASK